MGQRPEYDASLYAAEVPVTTQPLAGYAYALRYFPQVDGVAVDVDSVDLVELFATPERTGAPLLSFGPAVRTRLGEYEFQPVVMPPAGVYHAVVTFTAAGVVQTDSDDSVTVLDIGGALTATSPIPTLPALRAHLNLWSDVDDAELSDKLAAAVRLLRTHPDYPGVAESLDSGRADPLLRLAIMEQVRDIWSGTQRGAGAASMTRRFEGDYAYQSSPTDTVAGLGRPALPPYVARLLVSYSRLGGGAVYEPRGEFPPALVWPLS